MQAYAVIGLGQLGAAVARYLAERGCDVIAIDRDMGRVEALKDCVARALCMDATNENALREAGVVECSAVVLALGEDQLEEAVLTTMLLRHLGVGHITSRAATDVQGMVLERLGVSRVVFPERNIGEQIARQIMSPGVQELLPLGEGAAVGEVAVSEAFWGRTLAELQLRREFGLNVVAIKRLVEGVSDSGELEERWEVDNGPGPDSRLGKGDLLVVVGPDDLIAKFAERAP